MNLRPALLLSSLLALPLVTLAQPPAPGEPAAPHARHHGGPPSPERMTEHMRRTLDLNEEQTQKVGKLNEEFAEDMKKLHDQFQEDLQEVLTPEQYAKLEQMRAERHSRKRPPREPTAPESPAPATN